jgi:pimeloyl-ACP methyl ester carboxylesterase
VRRTAVAVALLFPACTQPATEFARHASALGMRREVVAGTGFQHVLFRHNAGLSGTWHVYVDGDGTPWDARAPAEDPTPRNPLVLRLMARDTAPGIYLGRPCYHGLAGTAPCSTAAWTAQRYSEAVVSSMAAALERALAGTSHDRLVWFGYSGGGVLAMLLAPRFEATTDVVTVGANLDIDAWADLHGYARLAGSINPARQPSLPGHIRQRHYAGAADRVVPKEVVARGPIPPGTLEVIPGYDHVCCWEEMWPAILATVGRARPPLQGRPSRRRPARALSSPDARSRSRRPRGPP